MVWNGLEWNGRRRMEWDGMEVKEDQDLQTSVIQTTVWPAVPRLQDVRWTRSKRMVCSVQL